MNKINVKIQFPILSVLAVAFIILKLCGVIAWSWLWVLSPIWIPLAVVLALLAFAGLLWFIAYVANKVSKDLR